MRFRNLYRLLAFCTGPRARETAASGVFASDARLRKESVRMLRSARVYGASLCVFDREGIAGELCVGNARPDLCVMPGTFFRTASVSKMVTGAVAAGLAADGVLKLDMDVRDLLGIRVPAFPDAPVTVRMLMNHTSSLKDSGLLEKAAEGLTLAEAGPRFAYTGAEPGRAFRYSNEGAALLGAVLETVTGRDLDDLLHQAFGPSGSYFPDRLGDAVLADAVRIVPRPRTAYSGEKMQARGTGGAGADPQRHWGRAHGSLCLRAVDAARIAGELLRDPRYDAMFSPTVAFGSRDPDITEGLAMFLVNTPSGPVCGHQGLAYGAAHGIFFNRGTGRGFALLTSGCSLSRVHVLTDLNKAAIRRFAEDRNPWRK